MGDRRGNSRHSSWKVVSPLVTHSGSGADRLPGGRHIHFAAPHPLEEATEMAEEPTQRRLAAVLAADVVAYSRLMGVNEVGTLDQTSTNF